MANAETQQSLRINYGHNGEQIVIGFSLNLRNVYLTTEQGRDMIRGIEDAIAMLAAHQERVRMPPANG